MVGCLAARSSAILPVPSGELSSTTKRSTDTGRRKSRSAIMGRFSRSLYVGTMTSVLFMHQGRETMNGLGPQDKPIRADWARARMTFSGGGRPTAGKRGKNRVWDTNPLVHALGGRPTTATMRQN